MSEQEASRWHEEMAYHTALLPQVYRTDGGVTWADTDTPLTPSEQMMLHIAESLQAIANALAWQNSVKQEELNKH